MSNSQNNLFVDEDTSDPCFNLRYEETLSTDCEDEIPTDFTGMSSDSDILGMLSNETSHTENGKNTTTNFVYQDPSINHISNITPKTNIGLPTVHIECNNDWNDNDNIIIIATQEPSSINKNDNAIVNNNNVITIDLDAEEQQVVEILDDEEGNLEQKRSKKPPEPCKPVQ